MKTDHPYYLYGHRVLTHLSFWVAYYLLFSLIWAKNGDYLSSFYLEFLLLPVRIGAAYLTLYILIPELLLKKKFMRLAVGYALLLIVGGVLQSLIIDFFDFRGETYVVNVASVVRAMVLVNTTVLFLAALKIFQLWDQEHRRCQLLEQAKQPSLLNIKANQRIYRVRADEILFIEGLGNYITYHLADGSQLISYSSLKKAEQELPDFFARIHKSFIINTHQIRSYGTDTVEIGQKQIPIGATYQADFA